METESIKIRYLLVFISAFYLWFFESISYAVNTKLICRMNSSDTIYSLEIKNPSDYGIKGSWETTKSLRKKNKQAEFSVKLLEKKDFYLLESSRLELARLCYKLFHAQTPSVSLYFTEIEDVKAYKADDHHCSGHQIVQNESANFYNVFFRMKSSALKEKLKDYNFSVVLEGMVYRSKMLGRKGILDISERLQRAHQPAVKSIASIHVMGYGGPGGDYNLQELETAQEKGITFLFSYAYDPKLFVYMDGTDPSKIIEDDPDHGNIYDQRTVEKFVPDPSTRSSLGVGRSIAEKRMLIGNTMDFLQSIENIIDAPWPILIHCKGGRHKTGMFSLILEYLAFKESMAEDKSRTVSVPMYKNRIARWLDNKGSLWEIFMGGSFYEKVQLRPAEVHYFEHNKSVFRYKNIEFVRGIVSGKYLKSQELKDKWKAIQEKFRHKVRAMAPFAIGQY